MATHDHTPARDPEPSASDSQPELRACDEIADALEAFWRKLGREVTFRAFADSVFGQIHTIKDDRLRAALTGDSSIQAAVCNLKMGSTAREQWEEHLSYAFYCLGRVHGPGPDTPIDAARSLAARRHLENNDCKRIVQEFYQENT